MASPNKVFKQFPLPESSQVPGFLASCPVLAEVGIQQLELLASELHLIRYEDGTRFFTDETPNRRDPLRFVVHGRATWDSNRSSDQKSAWMMTPGSAFGLEAVNDWAREHALPETWSRGEMPLIRCQAIGVVWVLELAPDRFDAAFLPELGRPALTKLLQMVPTICNAPDIVATMRTKPQFARAAPVNLYKLLEWAPTLKMWPVAIVDPNDPNQGEQPEPEPGPTAVYYVLEGEVKLQVDDESKTIDVGEMDGADLFTPTSEAVTISSVSAVSEASVVQLTRSALETCMRQFPGFARTLGPRNESEAKP
ncbi:hypothetical protein ACNOYE_21340 [Nannocystaceae bacterium ST9]